MWPFNLGHQRHCRKQKHSIELRSIRAIQRFSYRTGMDETDSESTDQIWSNLDDLDCYLYVSLERWEASRVD